MDANNTEPGASAGFVQQAQLIGVGTPTLYVPRQGSAVALSADGNTALIGGPGSVFDVGATWVFTRTNGVWQQEQVLIGREVGPFQYTSGAKGINPTWWGNQGYAVALSADGNTALVGGPSDNNSDNNFKGTTWMFIRTNGVWRRGFGFLTGDDENKLLKVGASVALSSDAKRWFVVAPGNTGVLTVYGHPGADDGIANFYSAATCIALSGDGNTVIFGVPGTAVYVYAHVDGQNVWTQQAALPGSGSFGSSVALSADGNTALIGDPSYNNNNGTVYVFTRSNVSWTMAEQLVGPGAVGAAQQGASVALSADGNTVLIGGPGDSYGAPGAAWVLWRGGVRREVNWQKIAGTGGIGDAQTPIRQGSAVALSADGMTALIGGPGDNRNSGATWVFSIG
jgi:hypothetical protein